MPILNSEKSLFLADQLAGGSALGTTYKPTIFSEIYVVTGKLNDKPALAIQDFSWDSGNSICFWALKKANILLATTAFWYIIQDNTYDLSVEDFSELMDSSQFVPGRPVYILKDLKKIEGFLEFLRRSYNIPLSQNLEEFTSQFSEKQQFALKH